MIIAEVPSWRGTTRGLVHGILVAAMVAGRQWIALLRNADL